MADTGKPSLVVRIPTPVWLVVLILAALGAGALLGVPTQLERWPAGAAVIALGVAVAAWANVVFRKHGAQIIPSSQRHSALVASGPFRFTRNPMYLGMVTIGVGAALVVGTWLMWLVPVVVFAFDQFVIIPYEERSMFHTFGDAYRDYQARVRRWL